MKQEVSSSSKGKKTDQDGNASKDKGEAGGDDDADDLYHEKDGAETPDKDATQDVFAEDVDLDW